MPARVPPRGERLAHTASSRFHNDGRPYVEDDQRSSEDEVARRRRRRRARQAKTREGGETQSESESGSPDRQRGRGRNAPQGRQGTNAASLTDQLSRLCTLPSPGAAQLVADLQATSIPSASEIYESLEKQAAALKADATHVITRALSISGLSSDAASGTNRQQRVLPPLPPALPPVKRASLPPNSLRVAVRTDGSYAPRTPLTPVAEISLRVREEAPPVWAVMERERQENAAAVDEEEEEEYSESGSGSGSGSDAESSYDEEAGTGIASERRRPPPPSSGIAPSSRLQPSPAPAAARPARPAGAAPNGHSAARVPPEVAAASSSDGDDGVQEGNPLSRRMPQPPTRGASTLRYARSLSARAAASLRASGRGSARSPYAQSVKRLMSSEMVRAVSLAVVVDAVFAVLGTMLSVFVPQMCGPTPRVVLAGGLVIPASAAPHLCSIAEQLDTTRMTTLHQAVFLTNCCSLLVLLLSDIVFIWRELSLIDLCDEDRGAEWTHLSAQLSAFPRLGDRLDRLNGVTYYTAGGTLLVLTGNWVASAVLALSQQLTDYRTPVLLVALVLPSARRVGSYCATAGESRRKRLALPLWASGFVSLNCLDERWMRTGEEAVSRGKKTARRPPAAAKPAAGRGGRR